MSYRIGHLPNEGESLWYQSRLRSGVAVSSDGDRIAAPFEQRGLLTTTPGTRNSTRQCQRLLIYAQSLSLSSLFKAHTVSWMWTEALSPFIGSSRWSRMAPISRLHYSLLLYSSVGILGRWLCLAWWEPGFVTNFDEYCFPQSQWADLRDLAVEKSGSVGSQILGYVVSLTFSKEYRYQVKNDGKVHVTKISKYNELKPREERENTEDLLQGKKSN